MTSKVITRGDDLGSTKTANKAILDTFKKGILKNTSIMMPCAEVKHAAGLFIHRKDICIGLHCTVNSEWDNVKWGPVLPIEQVPTLVDNNGYFFQTTKELSENNPSVKQIIAEIQAQLDLAREMGFNIQYADLHMGFDWVIDGLKEKISLWCQEQNLLFSYNFNRPLPEVENIGDPVDQFITSLKKASEGQYLKICHPAYDNQEIRRLGHSGNSGYKVAQSRNWQRKIFMDERVINFFNENKIKSIKFTEAEAII
ncbi:MAG: ChbG/HpnK family deacetylase [Bacillota bacterium]